MATQWVQIHSKYFELRTGGAVLAKVFTEWSLFTGTSWHMRSTFEAAGGAVFGGNYPTLAEAKAAGDTVVQNLREVLSAD